MDKGSFYILHGADEFSARERLRQIKVGLGDEQSLTSNTTVFEGQRVRLNQLVDTCMAIPFLGSHRLVVVEGLLSSWEKMHARRQKSAQVQKGDSGEGYDGEADTGNGSEGYRDEWMTLGERVADIPPTTVLVLIDGSLDKKRNALIKKLTPVASVEEFPEVKGKKLREWVRQQIEERGIDITPEAVALLISLVGSNLRVLVSEMDKLSLYSMGRSITIEDIKVVVSQAREASLFAMVDAVIEGRTSVAASILQQLIREGVQAPHLIVMITRQLRMMVVAKELCQKRLPASEVKARLASFSGSSHDFVLTKAIEQSRRYSMDRLEVIYRRVLDSDLSIKTGMASGDVALYSLVVELCV